MLRALLLTPNQVVSVDSLVEAVWDGQPPATARRQIQVCVAALRRTFARIGVAGVISTHPPGYLVRVPSADDETLAAAAAEAQEEGRLEEAVLFLRAGLAQEPRLAALERCVDLELRLGWHHTLIDELAALVREHPLHERLRGQLMTALFRADRAEDALETYWAGWRIMLDELDTEPGEELRRIEAEILAHTQPAEHATEPSPRPGPRQLPAGIPDFTGRAELVEAAETALSTGDTTLVITGPAGIGKTALALHVAHRVARHFPDGQLYCDLGGTQQDVLAQFLEALGARVPDTLYERVAAYRDLLATRRVLVVLDDVVSARQVTPLLPGPVIVTSRVPLPGLPRARVLEVAALPPEHATALLGKVIGPRRVAAEPAAATTLVRLAKSPLALRVVAARLAARPHWSLASMIDRLSTERQTLAPSR